MARPFPWKCRTCGEQKLTPTVVDYRVDMEHDGRLYALTVPDLEILQCTSCGARVLPEEAHTKITDALRASAGLLTPAEIRQYRDRLGLTQKQLAAYLKVADATVSRWETGGQIQQRAMDLLLRGFFDVPELRRYYAALSGLPVPRQPSVTAGATVP